jgi:hypothetical protein
MSVPSHGTAEHPLRPSLSRSREGQRAGSSAHPHRRSQRASGTCGTNRRSRRPYGRPRSSSQLRLNSLSDLNRVLKEQRALCLRQLAKMDEARHLSSDPARREVDAAPRDGAPLVLSEIEAALRRIRLGVEVVEDLAVLLTVALAAVGGEANHEGEERGQ